jgi:hypothetical protein
MLSELDIQNEHNVNANRFLNDHTLHLTILKHEVNEHQNRQYVELQSENHASIESMHSS